MDWTAFKEDRGVRLQSRPFRTVEAEALGRLVAGSEEHACRHISDPWP